MEKQTVTLAHGTSASLLEEILRNGLKPRGDAVSHWGNCPSHRDRVYLTDAYAFYFAQNAAGDDDLLIVEVEVDRAKLVPDEDYLGQSSHGTEWEDKYPGLIERTLAMRDAVDKMPRKQRIELAARSLAALGSAAHIGRIFPAAIRRMARVPAQMVPHIVMTECDPTISIRNYRFMGGYYRAFQKSLFTRFPL
jgi:hypothetical protein